MLSGQLGASSPPRSLLSVDVVMVQYYTLEQAARILQTTPDKVKEMAKQNEVRALPGPRQPAVPRSGHRRAGPYPRPGQRPRADAGAGPQKPAAVRRRRRKSKIPPQQPIAFVEDDEAPIGKETTTPGGSKGGPSVLRPQERLAPANPRVRKPTMAQPGPKSPPPRATSDSDVRLVARGQRPRLPGRAGGAEIAPPAVNPPSSKSGSKKTTRSSKLRQEPTRRTAACASCLWTRPATAT